MSAGSVAMIAFGASSALGEGEAALGVGNVGDVAPVAIARDAELAAAGLTRPFCGRAAITGDSRDRATVLFERALRACASELDAKVPGWRSKRVGLAIGTSSGGMRAFESVFGGAGDAGDPLGNAAATYLGPVLSAARPVDFSPFAFVLGACASGTLAIGLAREWLAAGACDIALCGGFDAVSVFVASGFEALRATCTDGAPRPFRTGRDGLALGEGAAVLALVREEDAPPSGAGLAHVIGFGASCDAVHLTAPDREGKGLGRAAAQALAEAGAPVVALVSAHATATEYNDAAEARALAQVLGARLAEVPVHALKGGIGHTLGAAGALETLSAAFALAREVAPASAGAGAIDGGVRVLAKAERLAGGAALKLSAAFGGANAALVLSRDPVGRAARATTQREVFVSRAVRVTDDATAHALAARTGYSEDKLARADLLVRLTIAAVAELRDARGPLAAGTGILVGHGLATVDTNALYLARIRTAGAARAEPRRFPYTTPNAPAGECAVAFGLTGPSFAVGGGPHGGLEALACAADLVRGGVADQMLVVAADEAGEASRRLAPETVAGAVALLVSRDKLAARLEAWETRLPRTVLSASLPTEVTAHRALLPLVKDSPATLSAAGFASLRLFWL